jgi:hypothetical protein
MDKGYILLSRNLLESDVFASQKLLKIWIWCLCKANFKDRSVPLKVGKGETIVHIKRGSFLFGRHKAEDELFIDGSTIYKSIKKLQDMEMITIKSNNQYSVITICKYDEYQDNGSYKVTSKDQPSNNKSTSKDQPSNTTNTLTNVNKDNNVKEDNNTPLAFSFYNSLISYGFNKDLVSDWIKVRKNKRLTNSETAFNNFIKEVEKTKQDKNKVIEKCVIKSWGGFKAEWFNKEQVNNVYVPSPTSKRPIS